MAKDPYRYFRIEARELLDQLYKSALELEVTSPAGDQAGSLMRVLRVAHTLKGAAHVVKQAEIAELTHAVEGVLTPYREGKQSLPRPEVDRVLKNLDLIAQKLDELPASDGSEPQPLPAATKKNTPIPPSDAASRVARTDTTVVDALLEGLGEISSELNSVKKMLATLTRAKELAGTIPAQLEMPRLAESQHNLPHNQRQNTFSKVRSTMETVNSMMLSSERGILAGIERLERELRDTRDTAERLRLVPATSIFTTLERTARDASLQLGKAVHFHAKGSDVRLDAHVLDTVQSALVQIVRNAIVHGIETEQERLAVKKQAVGQLNVEVLRRGHKISFICHDDGRGIDLDAVRRSLLRSGQAAAVIEKMSVENLFDILLKGGISTAGTVTELAGRGIGLDLVREAIQGIGGEVLAHTEAGLGTRIELQVPVSMASIDALIIGSAGRTAAIPLDAVTSTLRISSSDIVKSPQGDNVRYEDKLLPLVHPILAPRPEYDYGHRAFTSSIVIVSAVAGIAAVIVDQLHGIENIVLQPLPLLAPANAVVAGIHLGNGGAPQLVLDPDVLISDTHGRIHTKTANATPQNSILVIDDSLTTRMLESSILESAGFSVSLAASAEEGLEMAKKNDYSLFLVDLEMPGMNGFEFIELTRADTVLSRVPCILVTSRDAQEDRQRAAEAGASAYIVKGEFDQHNFLQRIAELVRS